MQHQHVDHDPETARVNDVAVTSPTGKHFMPGDAELERIGIRIVVYPQDVLAASVRAMRDALAGLKGGIKPPMATSAELATAVPPSPNT